MSFTSAVFTVIAPGTYAEDTSFVSGFTAAAVLC